MREKDARKKWCHATAYRTLYDDAARHPDNHNAHMNRCIAADCMAWRHHTLDEQVREGGPVGGYCGLAGEPK